MAAQPAPVFRGGVALVHVDAEVTLDGRIVNGLTKEDFRVFDERVEQPVIHFAAEQVPLDLILLFDVSGSMRPALQAVASAARQGLQELRQGDRVCVRVFNRFSQEIAPFTSDLEEVQGAIEKEVLTRKFGGTTLIQEALDSAALRFMKEPRSERRRAVLIITDDFGVRTRREHSIVRDFWEADAILSGLIIRHPGITALHTGARIIAPQNMLLEAGMKGTAAKTGGDAIHSKDGGSAFQESMRRIRGRYSLYYAQPPGTPQSIRSIRVELSADAASRYPKARVRARTGYVVSTP